MIILTTCKILELRGFINGTGSSLLVVIGKVIPKLVGCVQFHSTITLHQNWVCPLFVGRY